MIKYSLLPWEALLKLFSMKKIAIYIRSKDISPSGYYRILQYTDKLEGRFYLHNILPPSYYKYYLKYKHISILSPFFNAITYMLMYVRCLVFLTIDSVRRIDIIIVSRGLLPKYFLFPISYLFKNLLHIVKLLIWDFDDDILLSGEISRVEYDFLSKNSNHIFVTHNYLAEKISCEYRDKVVIIPTTDGDFLHINIDLVLNIREDVFKKELRLVWTGSAVNLVHLSAAIPALDACAQVYIEKYKKSIILNVCSSEPLLCTADFLTINNVSWSRQAAVELIEYSHIGIMPLLPSEYSLGKGGFKLIQYMAAGLPIIGSNVGFNRTVIKENFGLLIDNIAEQKEWMNALELFGVDFESYRNAAICSLKEWNNFYHTRSNLEIWSKSIDTVIK